jgi:hypothetical protein
MHRRQSSAAAHHDPDGWSYRMSRSRLDGPRPAADLSMTRTQIERHEHAACDVLVVA